MSLTFWLGIVVLAGLVWVALYYGVYPWLLRYYPPGVAKRVFWPLLLLYYLLIMHLLFYSVFPVAHLYWQVRWVVVAVALLLFLWSALSVSNRKVAQ